MSQPARVWPKLQPVVPEDKTPRSFTAAFWAFHMRWIDTVKRRGYRIEGNPR